MRASHRYVQFVARECKVPRRIECDLRCKAARWCTFNAVLLTYTCDCFDGLRVQVNTTDGMVLGVSDIECIAGERDTLWTIELCLRVGTIDVAFFARTDNGAYLAIEVRFKQAMMGRVADDEAVRGCIDR